MSSATTEAPAVIRTENQPSLDSLIARVAGIIGAEHFATGERAALKRLGPNEPGLAFFRFWPRYLGAEAPPDSRVADWVVIISGIALMGRNGHKPGRRFGAVLAESRYSEGRLERLLATEDADIRRVLFARAVRFLAAKGESFDWVGAATWLLSSGDNREDAARRIARDYYPIKFKQEKEDKE